ncbi:hypothetical protein MFRU_006g01200 [Monilinia fructicola]|nr:hypothetical protein MFRU_006g01200 [Monilinia fructicola]
MLVNTPHPSLARDPHPILHSSAPAPPDQAADVQPSLPTSTNAGQLKSGRQIRIPVRLTTHGAYRRSSNIKLEPNDTPTIQIFKVFKKKRKKKKKERNKKKLTAQGSFLGSSKKPPCHHVKNASQHSTQTCNNPPHPIRRSDPVYSNVDTCPPRTTSSHPIPKSLQKTNRTPSTILTPSTKKPSHHAPYHGNASSAAPPHPPSNTHRASRIPKDPPWQQRRRARLARGVPAHLGAPNRPRRR